jgi:fucose 4-O-acetylase-like acetyltransferase
MEIITILTTRSLAVLGLHHFAIKALTQMAKLEWNLQMKSTYEVLWSILTIVISSLKNDLS